MAAVLVAQLLGGRRVRPELGVELLLGGGVDGHDGVVVRVATALALAVHDLGETLVVTGCRGGRAVVMGATAGRGGGLVVGGSIAVVVRGAGRQLTGAVSV